MLSLEYWHLMFRNRLSWIPLLCCLTQLPIAAEEPLVIDLGEGVSIELVRISKGTFTQGSPASEQGREVDEAAREVTLSRDFSLGTTPVTVGQFRRFVASTNHKTEAESGSSGGFGVMGGKLVQQPQFNWRNPGYAQTDEHPVTIVTVADAAAFLSWLSSQAGRTMTLPTEAQWEYACRAGSAGRFHNGNDDTAMDAIGWSQKNASLSPMPVKQKLPNAFGLYDMSGNVYEWCQDIYNLYPAESVSDPLQLQGQPGEKVRNVLRGGSWMRLPKRCRSAARYRATPGTRNAENGFRVATMDLQVVAASPATEAPPQASENVMPPVMEPVSNAVTGDLERFVAPGPSVSPESSLFAAFFFFLLILFMAWLARKIYQSVAGHASDTSQRISRPRTKDPDRIDEFAAGSMAGILETLEDGFWFSTESYSIGTMLQCEYWCNKTLFSETVEVTSPVRQFFYTGSPPTDIRILVADSVSRPGNLNAPNPTEYWTPETEPSPSRNNPQPYVFVDPLRASRSHSDRDRDDSQTDSTTNRGNGFPPAY
ncbi:MAG: formylglycine-generating enzyme family protein [Planctomycetota bacterium]